MIHKREAAQFAIAYDSQSHALLERNGSVYRTVLDGLELGSADAARPEGGAGFQQMVGTQ
jgi:hypothetical protein